MFDRAFDFSDNFLIADLHYFCPHLTLPDSFSISVDVHANKQLPFWLAAFFSFGGELGRFKPGYFARSQQLIRVIVAFERTV
jgi:hypothetical protein